MKNKIIEVDSLTKSFGKIHAVKGINFYVEEGSLFAFLGENGAGKSTTIDMLCTLLKPDSGTAIINNSKLGKYDKKIRAAIGIVFQDGLLDSRLTVRENLYFRGGLYGISGKKLKQAVENAAKTTGIIDFIDRPYGNLSGGQRRQADITRALIHTPKILFFDEPTTGLDPQARENVWRTVRALRECEHMTVFLTTHYMEEAAEADYITVMGSGKILAKGTPIELKQKYANDSLKIKPKNKEMLARLFNDKNIQFKASGENFLIELKSTLDAIKIIYPYQDLIDNIEITNGTMNDVFINIINKVER